MNGLTSSGEPDAGGRGDRRRALLALALAFACGCNSSSGPGPAPAAPACGNGIRETGEGCDDGNLSDGDSCLSICQPPAAFVPTDPHVHSTGCGNPSSPGELAERLRRQGLQVGAALAWGWDYDVAAALFTGRDHPVSGPGLILHYDLELSRVAAARTGHLLVLGLDSLAYSPDVFNVPQSGVPVVEWARRQPRAVVGMAHAQYWPADGSFPLPPGGCCVPWEVAVHAARGRLDFLSMERSLEEEPGTWRLYRAIQNAGLRVAIAGASDFPCFTESFGETTLRTDVILDGALSYESWLAAIRASRTTAAFGPENQLNLRVDGRGLGQELALSGAGEVTATVEAAGRPAEVEVLVNGAPAARLAFPGGRQVAHARLRLEKSAWVVARSRYVLTSPVYVVIDGRPVRGPAEDVCYLLRSVEHLQDLVTSRRLRLFESTDEALQAYGEAAAELRRRFAEAGGGVC